MAKRDVGSYHPPNGVALARAVEATSRLKNEIDELWFDSISASAPSVTPSATSSTCSAMVKSSADRFA